jgi:hypothetical protein
MDLIADEDSYVVFDPDQLALEDYKVYAVAAMATARLPSSATARTRRGWNR